MTIKRAFIITAVLVGIPLLLLVVLLGCGSGSKDGPGRGTTPAGARTAPGVAVGPQLLLFTSPG